MSESIITKKCSHCKKIKPISEFYKNRVTKDGFSNQCKICCIKNQKLYRQSPKGKAVQKRYKQSEKGKISNKRYSTSQTRRNTSSRYYYSEKGQIYHKNYRKTPKYKERSKIAATKSQTKNPQKWHARHTVNNAVRDGKLIKLSLLKCYYCGNQAKHYHHWHGYSQKYILDVIPVCKKCHKNR